MRKAMFLPLLLSLVCSCNGAKGQKTDNVKTTFQSSREWRPTIDNRADAVMEPCSCAMTVHHGPYSTLSEAYGAVISWIAENGYEIAGAPFDLYTKTQLQSLSPEDWETEVYFPIRKK